MGAIVWPGSAQFIAGRRVLGAIVMTLVAGFGITCAVLWFMYQPSRSDLINAVTSGPALGIARWAFVGVVAAWLLLFIDAWRLATIPNMGIMRKLGVSLLSVVVIAGASGVGFVGWTTASASKKVVESVFTATVEKPPLEGRYNILLVGADSGKGRTGMRPDSMNVVSIDAATGVPVMISLPRNLQKVPFVDGSPMQQIYPYGYNCGTECLLNAVHTAASNRADLYPDSVDPGMSATIDAVEGVTGLSINYHIVVNMKGFSKLVDAIGGVEMDIDKPIAMFGKEDSWKNEYIPAGKQRLDGRQALWYGRSRYGADDYSRMGRQKCLLRAIANQATPQTVLLKASGIAESSADMLSTDIPATELGAFGDLALKSRNQPMATLSIVPPLYSTVNPNFEQIRSDIADLIAKSEREAVLREQAKRTTATPKPSKPAPSATPSPSESSGTTNNTDDLDSLC
ncbi:MAG: LCP family protein [Actinomycetales bacterium]|nr:LCP family protein [Actinomycetales bacterium]